VEQLRKAYTGNDIWALAVVELSDKQAETTITVQQPSELAALLGEFEDVLPLLPDFLSSTSSSI
jgi:hypothetical protein